MKIAGAKLGNKAVSALRLGATPIKGGGWNGQYFTSAGGTNFPFLGFAQFTTPTTAVWDANVDDAMLDARLAMGYDAISLMFDPRDVIAAAPGSATTAKMDIAFYAVDKVIARGLKVVLRMMVSDEPTVLAAYPAGASWLRWLEVLKQFGARCQAYSNQQLTFDLWNETAMAVGTGWPARLEAMHAAFRTTNLNTQTLLAGAFYASPEGLAELTPANFADPWGGRIHLYEPYLPTHQGYPVSEIGVSDFAKPFRRLTYPPIKGEKATSIAAAKAVVDTTTLSAGDKTSLKASIDAQAGFYFDNPRDRYWLISNRFSIIDTWMTTNSVPGSRVFMTEFGMKGDNASVNGGSLLSRARNAQDVSDLANRRGIAAFVYADQDSNYFGVTASRVVMPEIAAAMAKVSPVAFDTEATTLFGRATATVSNADKSFANALIRMLKTASLLTGKFDLLYFSGLPGLELINWANTYGLLSSINNGLDAATGIYTKSATNSRMRVATDYTPGQASQLYAATGHMAVTTINVSGNPSFLFRDVNAKNVVGPGGNVSAAIAGAYDFSTNTMFNDTGYTSGAIHTLAQRTGASANSSYVEGVKVGSTTTNAYAANTPGAGNPLSIFDEGDIGLRVSGFSMGGAVNDTQARDFAHIAAFHRTHIMRKYGL